MRCFIALKLPDEARAALAEASRRLAPFYPGARWVKPESLHVTLAFLGEIDGSALECARLAVLSSVGSGAFSLGFSGLECLPVRGPARVLALGADAGTRECLDVHERVNRTLAEAARDRGLPPPNPDWPDGRPFRVHVTLARASGRPFGRETAGPRGEIRGILQAPFPISQCILYRSELRPDGARYEPLCAADL